MNALIIPPLPLDVSRHPLVVDLPAFRKDDLAMSENEAKNFMERAWEAGQQHLVGGRYVAVCAALESAEAIAWTAEWYGRLAQGEPAHALCLEQISRYEKLL